MANTNLDDEVEEAPLDPAMERVRRKMIRLLAVSIGIMVIGLMAVLTAVVYKVMKRDDTSASQAQSDIPGQLPLATVLEGTIALDKGDRVVSQSLGGNRLSLDVIRFNGSREILIYDYAEGRIVARVKLAETN
ncbi:MAG: fimbrial protein [Phyllobacterium sp.]